MPPLFGLGVVAVESEPSRLDIETTARTMTCKPIREGDNHRAHGTAGGYSNHACRCPDCTEAWRVYITARNHRLGYHVPWADYLASFPIPHGTAGGYKRCVRRTEGSCQPCRDAAAKARRERRSRTGR